jgi:hypothetical protein
MATISSITEVRRVIEIGFDYEPGTTGNPVTTSVTYDGQNIQVSVQLPSESKQYKNNAKKARDCLAVCIFIRIFAPSFE